MDIQDPLHATVWVDFDPHILSAVYVIHTYADKGKDEDGVRQSLRQRHKETETDREATRRDRGISEGLGSLNHVDI